MTFNFEFDFGHACCTKQYPPSSKIKAKYNENLDKEDECKMAIPCTMRGRNGKLTIMRIRQAIESVKADLQEDIQQYEDILEQGDDAMSKYDLNMGYTAQTSGLPLKYNHICHNLGCLQVLNHWLEKFVPVKQLENIKTGRQMELFDF